MLKFVLLRDVISLESGSGFERTLPRDVISEPVNDQIPDAISINSLSLDIHALVITKPPMRPLSAKVKPTIHAAFLRSATNRYDRCLYKLKHSGIRSSCVDSLSSEAKAHV